MAYWTCSKFADWIRGTPHGGAKTAEGWDEWRETARAKSAWRYWLADEGLGYVEDVVKFIPKKIHSVKYYINNRWVTRTHALTANPRDLPRGQWCDVGNRFLPCLFNELQDFVEVELAWWHIAWADKDEKKKYKAPFWATGWFRWRTWRCPQAGLDNLDWQRNLRWQADEVGDDSPNLGKPTYQAIKAQEILDLYKWWTEVYRNRPDPYEASGWHAYCAARREEHGNGISALLKKSKDPKIEKMGAKALKLCHKIEQQYEKEDEEMMIRLIKIRNSLWT
jgi:hypothetical protein